MGSWVHCCAAGGRGVSLCTLRTAIYMSPHVLGGLLTPSKVHMQAKGSPLAQKSLD